MTEGILIAVEGTGMIGDFEYILWKIRSERPSIYVGSERKIPVLVAWDI